MFHDALARTGRKAGLAVALAGGIVVVGAAVPASAADLELPAGEACEFPVEISYMTQPQMRHFAFRNESGENVEVDYGIGSELVVANPATGKSFVTDADPVATRTTYRADDSRSVLAAGANLIILNSSDDPGDQIGTAPSITLVEGAVFYTISPENVWTIDRVHGRMTDVCAEIR